MNTSDDIQINIECNQEDAQRRNEIRALKTMISTASWRARRETAQGRHMDAADHRREEARLQRQLAELE